MNLGTQGGWDQGFFLLFFLAILWCSHTGNHPQEELANFGYKSSERKVGNFKNPVIFLATCLETSICLKDDNFRIIFSVKSGDFGTFVFPQKSFCISHARFQLSPSGVCGSSWAFLFYFPFL